MLMISIHIYFALLPVRLFFLIFKSYSYRMPDRMYDYDKYISMTMGLTVEDHSEMHYKVHTLG